MSYIKVEEVDNYSNARQPNVSVVSPKLHATTSQTANPPVPVQDTHPLPRTTATQHHSAVDDHGASATLHEHQSLAVDDHVRTADVNYGEVDCSPRDDDRGVENAEILDHGRCESMKRIPPLTIEVDRSAGLPKKLFKRVKPRKAYASKDTYRGLMRSSVAMRSARHASPATSSPRYAYNNYHYAENSRSEKPSIYQMLPGLIDFGLGVDENEGQSQECLDQNNGQDSVEGGKFVDRLELSKQSKAGTFPSMRNSELASQLQIDIARKSEQRQSACRLRKMKHFMDQCKTYERMFSKKNEERGRQYKVATSVSGSLPSKPPTEKERPKIVDYNEKYRFRIKSNKLKNSIYAKPIRQWGIVIGDLKQPLG